MRERTEWVLFTKRTDDPKLAYIEARLDNLGINFKRDGESFHAPMLYVDKRRINEAYALLAEKWSKTGSMGPNPRGRTSLDDMPDDHPAFTEFSPNEWETPRQMGWVGSDGRP